MTRLANACDRMNLTGCDEYHTYVANHWAAQYSMEISIGIAVCIIVATLFFNFWWIHKKGRHSKKKRGKELGK